MTKNPRKGGKNMTLKRKIKRLEKQNDHLRRENHDLGNQIPSSEYADKIDRSLERFEHINDDLMQLYLELHKNQRLRIHTYWKYRFAIFRIKLLQWCKRQFAPSSFGGKQQSS